MDSQSPSNSETPAVREIAQPQATTAGDAAEAARRPIEPLTIEQQRAIVAEYFDHIDSCRNPPPVIDFLPKANLPKISSSPVSSLMADAMIEGDLQELRNQIHHWLTNLRAWNVWIEVLARHPEYVRYQMEWLWVEPIAFRCLFQPSGMRDRIVSVATNALHQIRMLIDRQMPDRLLSDPAKPGGRPRHLSRREKEKQLASFARRWPSGAMFIEAVTKIDGGANRNATSDFRNRASHAIAPRFSVGITSPVTRSVQRATRLEQQTDGTFVDVPTDGMTVSYGFGGTDPLDMRSAWQTNLDEYLLTDNAYSYYVELLREAIESVHRTHGSDATD